jgi:hypothetical protein
LSADQTFVAESVMAIVERTIWILWLQGWDQAADLVKACRRSWLKLNPDWQIHFRDAETLKSFISVPPDLLKHGRDVFADQVRNELLLRHGGVWADATTYCLRPLSEWIDLATASGFFAFARPFPDIMLSNWFLAAPKGSHIADAWLRAGYEYWQTHAKREPFYWHHAVFAALHSSLVPYEQLLAPLTATQRFIVETAQTPMLKLTHKIDHQQGIAGTAYRWLCDRV